MRGGRERERGGREGRREGREDRKGKMKKGGRGEGVIL